MFITFEGGEGSGKSSVCKEVSKKLKYDGYDVLETREPGGVKIGEKIREILLDNNNTDMDPKTEALLYAASRRQHLVEKIIPALKENKIVLCDRFIDSSLVYQGLGRNIGVNDVYNINEFALQDGKAPCTIYLPDVTFYLKVDPSEGLKRINIRGEKLNRFDCEDLKFHKTVSDGFDYLSRMWSRIIQIDANKPFDEVVDEVYNKIIDKLKEKK